MSEERYRIAVAQLSPVFLDRDATVEKACRAIAEACAQGAKLIVFPEAYLPGYPDWVWVVPGNKKPLLGQLYGELLRNAVSIPDASTGRLGAAAREVGIHVAIGMNERNSEASNSSLFNTLLFIGPDGQILGKHRKLIPTGDERLVWAPGDGSTLHTFDTSLGKLGGLICWENYMPLVRNAMYAWGTQLYLAPTWDASENWQISLRHIAREGGMFVVGCCQAFRMADIPDRLEFKLLYPPGKDWINPGNSCVIGPDGKYLAGPAKEQETILYADIDLGAIPASKWIFDVAGHYARPDVFGFKVDRAPRPMIG